MGRPASWLCSAAAVLCVSSCGYIGPVRPPSPLIPVAANDLTAAEVGDHIEAALTLPAETTDQITIERFQSVDLRIGPDSHPFDFGAWLAASTRVSAPGNIEVTKEHQQVTSSTPASNWIGKDVAIAVRTADRHEHYSQWSNIIHLRVVDPLAPPKITADADSKGVRISLKSLSEGGQVRIMRQGPNDNEPVEAGVADSVEFFDTGADYGVRYRYFAVAFDDRSGANARSEPSNSVELTPIDTFPPEVPTNVTALAGPNSVEISWERSPAPDTKGYYVYRSENGGPFSRISELTTLPTYSDKAVKRGVRYSYQVNAVDERGNASERSAPVEVTF